MFKFLLLSCVLGISLSALAEEKVYICDRDVICDEKPVRLITTEQPISGVVKMYSYDGKLLLEEKVIDGKIDGLRKIYNDDMRIEVNYNKGIRQGTSTSFYPNGNIRMQFIYKDDVIDGIAKSYYENGQLYEEILYQNDREIKTLARYNKKGRKVYDKPDVLDNLIDAVRENNKEKVSSILKEYPNLNLDPPYVHMYINKPLFWAARSSDVEMLKILLDYGADIEGLCSYEDTPLITALEYQKWDNAKFLIENGADVNKANSFAISPLLGLASGFGPSDLFILAMEHGGDINKKNRITACTSDERIRGRCPEKYSNSILEEILEDINIPENLSEKEMNEVQKVLREREKIKQYLSENGFIK